MEWGVLQVDELESDECFEVTVTAVNVKGNSTPEISDIAYDGINIPVIGEYVDGFTLLVYNSDCGIILW